MFLPWDCYSFFRGWFRSHLCLLWLCLSRWVMKTRFLCFPVSDFWSNQSSTSEVFALRRGCLHPFLYLSHENPMSALASLKFGLLPSVQFRFLTGFSYAWCVFHCRFLQTFDRFQFDRRPASKDLIFSTGLAGLCTERIELYYSPSWRPTADCAPLMFCVSLVIMIIASSIFM